MYGTQFEVVDGEIKLKPVEDPETLDARRAEMGLPSITVTPKPGVLASEATVG